MCKHMHNQSPDHFDDRYWDVERRFPYGPVTLIVLVWP